MYQFMQDMSETIMEICLRNSKVMEECKNDFNEKERILAYNTACLGFIFDIAKKQGEESDWLSSLYNAISNRYDDGLRDVRTSRAWNEND